MASAMINGLLANGFEPSQLRASDPSEAALSRLRSLGLSQLDTSPQHIFIGADLVVVAVKPQVAADALAAVRDQIGANTAILSIAAGIPIASLQAAVDPSVPVIRCMPNTPAMIGKGASGLFATAQANDTHRALAEQMDFGDLHQK